MNDMGEKTYQLIITSKVSNDQDKNLIVQKLAALLKITEQRAVQLINTPKTVLKDNLDKETAEKYQSAISKTGADCKVINTSINELSMNDNKPTTLEDLDYSTSKYTCPECGADKDFYTDVCLKCGFDQFGNKVESKSKLKKSITFMIIVLVLIVIAKVAYQFGTPIFNKYATKIKIDNGLSLAFDTRDNITTFILETNFWPNQNIDANLDKNISNEIIKSIVIGPNSIMTVTLRAEPLNADSDKTVIFKPRPYEGKILWNCSKGTLENKFRPSVCKNNIQ